MTVHEIVKEYLQEHNYNGLYNSDGGCACTIDDLEPCDEMTSECSAGVIEECDCGEHDYHIVEEAKITEIKSQ